MDKKIELLKLEKRRYGLEESINEFELKQLKDGVPIQQIIGYIEFASVKIKLNQDVLIPRYETEELILLINSKFNKLDKLKILDLGTGSGFIAIALAKYFINSKIYATDISRRALNLAKQNAIENDAKNIYFIQSNWFENIDDKFDIIVSNPPYLNADEIEDKSLFNYEPINALIAADDGLAPYKIIYNYHEKYLNKNGILFFEINPRHREYFLKNNFVLVKDINNKERFAYLERN